MIDTNTEKLGNETLNKGDRERKKPIKRARIILLNGPDTVK